jgi:hypothetical protein
MTGTDARPFEKIDPKTKARGGRREGSGRKPGSPNKVMQPIREAAQSYGPAALEKAARLAGLVVDDAGQPIGMAVSEQVQLAALNLLFDRGYGRPPQAIVGDPDQPLRMVAQIELVALTRDDANETEENDG